MAVRFAQPYRFDRRQFAGMAAAGVIPRDGIELVEGVPWHAGTPVRFSSADYHRLGAAGVFHPDERVELIDGESSSGCWAVGLTARPCSTWTTTWIPWRGPGCTS